MLKDVLFPVWVAFGRHQFVLVTMFVLVFSACKKENAKPQWDVDLLVPIATSTLTISDLISDNYTTDVNNGVTLVYETELFSLSLDTVLSIPDTTFIYPYGLPFPGPFLVTGGTNILSTTDESKFGIEPIELSEVLIRSGEISLTARSKVNTPTVANLSLLSATLGSTPLATVLNIPAGTVANPTQVSQPTDLSGYHFDLRGPTMNAVNTLSNSISLATAVGAPDISITDQDSLIAYIAYNNIIPQYARGYFGMRSESFSESSQVDPFTNISGTLDFDQVKVLLKISNGIGIDAQLFLNTLSSVGQSTVNLNHQVMNGPINVTRGTDLGGTGFIPSYQEIELNEVNSNIDLFLENLPQQIDIDLDVDINPLANISNGNDFLYHDSQLTVDLATEIPLCLIASNLSLQSVTAVDLPGTEEAHAVQEGTLHLFAENGFPLEATVSLEIFQDVSNFFSIPGTGNLATAQVDANGEVLASTESKLSFSLSKEQIDLLHQAGNIRITVSFNTVPSGQQIKIRDTHYMKLQLTADFNYIVNG